MVLNLNNRIFHYILINSSIKYNTILYEDITIDNDSYQVQYNTEHTTRQISSKYF